MKKFVSFDGFEKGCSPKGKDLAETMQESCDEHLKPDEPESCSKIPCPPYWQKTCNIRCLCNGLVDVEEKDGCGNSRWVRSVDRVCWTDTGEVGCDIPKNRIHKEQINQCGDIRWVSTVELCCTPDWQNVSGTFNCDQTMLRVEQRDGCGNSRLKANGQSVLWTSTGKTRCQAGNIYEIEQINQCGNTRWTLIDGGCPCVSDWINSGPQRCTGDSVEQYQIDGCGANRWHNTNVAVTWVNNGEQRCSATGFIQTQQVSQCGTTRWFTTEDTCVNSPPPNEIGNFDEVDFCNSGPHESTRSFILNAATKLIQFADPTSSVKQSESWGDSSGNRADYEARITYISASGLDPTHRYSGSDVGTWYNLGDTTTVGGSFTAGITGSGRVAWDITEIRIDIRRVGGSIEGGASVGPIRLVGNGDC